MAARQKYDRVVLIFGGKGKNAASGHGTTQLARKLATRFNGDSVDHSGKRTTVRFVAWNDDLDELLSDLCNETVARPAFIIAGFSWGGDAARRFMELIESRSVGLRRPAGETLDREQAQRLAQ